MKEKSCKSEECRLEKGVKGGKSASRVGKKSENANRVSSFVWHPRVQKEKKDSLMTCLEVSSFH